MRKFIRKSILHGRILPGIKGQSRMHLYFLRGNILNLSETLHIFLHFRVGEKTEVFTVCAHDKKRTGNDIAVQAAGCPLMPFSFASSLQIRSVPSPFPMTSIRPPTVSCKSSSWSVMSSSCGASCRFHHQDAKRFRHPAHRPAVPPSVPTDE